LHKPSDYLRSQLSFSSLDYAAKKKTPKREVFLAEMSAVMPWPALEAVVASHYQAGSARKAGDGRSRGP
jgi:IS5 family transposase